MKPVSLAACYLLFFCSHLYAQANTWTVKAGQEIREAISADIQFRYPAFVPGNVYFKDGKNSGAPLDFNLLNEEMQFINSNGDTLSIDNESTINFITINNDTFYYFKGYLELVAGNPLAKLAKKQRLKVGDVRKIGGYGQASSTSAITSLSSVYNGVEVTKLTPRADLLLLKETIYYIGDSYNNFLQANRKNVMKMFGRHETVIENFLNENKIRFNNAEDLKMLINFLQKIL